MSQRGIKAEAQSTKIADAPFNKPAADTILRSSDMVDFRIRKAILCEASPVFEDMFALQPLPEDRKRKEREEEDENGAPIISVAANSQALTTLLLYIYPGYVPSNIPPETLCDVRRLAIDYKVTYVQELMEDDWKSYAEREPFRAYAIAFERSWQDGMEIAARMSLRRPLLTHPLPSYMENMRVGDLVRLQQYHDKCAQAAVQAAVPSWAPGPGKYVLNAIDPKHCWMQCRIGSSVEIQAKGGGKHKVPLWFIDTVQRLLDTLRTTPCGAALQEQETLRKLADPSLRCCIGCRCNGYWDLAEFAKALADKVEEAVSKVDLGLPKPSEAS